MLERVLSAADLGRYGGKGRVVTARTAAGVSNRRWQPWSSYHLIWRYKCAFFIFLPAAIWRELEHYSAGLLADNKQSQQLGQACHIPTKGSFRCRRMRKRNLHVLLCLPRISQMEDRLKMLTDHHKEPPVVFLMPSWDSSESLAKFCF